jgi:hypothetical protein
MKRRVWVFLGALRFRERPCRREWVVKAPL